MNAALAADRSTRVPPLAEPPPPRRMIEGAGTDEATWSGGRVLADLDECDIARWADRHHRIWLLSPHPDEEVLGLGGSLALLSAAGASLSIVSITDGTASHAGSSLWPVERLADERPRELRQALDALRITADVHRVDLPDGRVNAHVDRLFDWLATRVGAEDLLLSTWRHDGHPDHEATGHVAASVAHRTGAALIEYPVWMWHWASPDGPGLPWRRARRIHLDAGIVERKRAAIGAFASQLAPDGGRDAILPPHVVERFLRPFETVFV